jgi:hypothetical protein
MDWYAQELARMSASAEIIPFIPTVFVVPEMLETDEFRLRMLTVNNVVKDYAAVMSSVDHCKSIGPGGTRPEGLTLEQNSVDLGWHQKEFKRRRSFACTVVLCRGRRLDREGVAV